MFDLNVYIVDIYIGWIIDKRRAYFHFITKLPMVRLCAGEPIVDAGIGNICQQVIVLLLILLGSDIPTLTIVWSRYGFAALV